GAGGAADEATQALTYTLTALPRAIDSLLQFTTTATALTANARLSTAYQAGDVLTATLISANQNPIPIRYTVQAADISLTSAVATRTNIAAGLAAAINATPALNGVAQAAVTNGDPERLSFTATAAGVSIELVSDTSLGTVLLRNPNNQLTAVAPGQVLNLEQIKALEFRPSEGITDLSAAARLGQFSFTVNDDGSAATGGGASRQQRISILVDTNKASARSGARITGITSDEQAIAAAMSLDPTNPSPGVTDTRVKGLSTSLYSQLDTNNPLYLAEIGGKGAIDGDAINYTPAAVPFLFDLPVPNSTPGAQLTHRLTYKSTLTGQFRSNAEGNSYSLVAPVAGFSLSSAGSWSFDPLNAAYQALPLNQTQTVTVNYREQTTGPARSFTLELSRIELGDGDTTIMATPTGPDANRTSFSRGDWIASSSEGRAKDRYFKFISEATLVSYGAVDTGQVNEDGDKLFTWTGTLQTADGQPLTLLDGTPITSPGYYDFTRRDGTGDGVEFIYQTVTEKGKEVDYIVGMKFFLTNNMYGDNDPARDNIRDPGAPITVMEELGEITTSYGYASYENVETSDTFNFQTSVNTIRTLFTGNPNPFDGGAGRVIQSTVDGAGRTPQQPGQAAAVINAGGAAGGAAPGQSAISLQGGEDGKEADSGDQDTQGASKVAQGAGANGKQQRPDGADRDGPAERGLKLDPLQQLATAATAEPSTLLEQLSDTNILGTNLLDALALGAGVLYLLYGPKAIEASKGGLRGWLAGGIGRRQGAAAAVPGERSVMALFLMRQPSGAAQLVAARVGQGTLQLLAQEDLPAQAAGNRLAEPLQTLLERLPQDRYELLLLDPRLQAAAAATARVNQLSERRQSLATEQLSAPLAACSDNELAQLRAWLNKPSGTLPEDLPLIQLLQQRQQSYANGLPDQQATMASLIELSLALAWSERA
ncbi:MAG: SwmB-cell surface protein required for swimming motility, partial [Cyanobacteriota bacterium]